MIANWNRLHRIWCVGFYGTKILKQERMMRVIGRLLLVILVVISLWGCGKKSGIEGKVVDGRGKPVTNVKIIAKQVQPIKGYEQFETTTGSDGAFRFKGLFPTSEYILFAWGESLEPQTKITVKSGPEGQISMLPSDMVIRFTTPKDGVITDAKTGLQWAQEANGKEMNLNQANAYVQELRLGGYSGWRLPTKEELESLITYCEGKGIPIEAGECYNKIGFKNVPSSYYWSSTDSHTDFAWIINMWNGGINSEIKFTSHGYYVWPVRSGQ